MDRGVYYNSETTPAESGPSKQQLGNNSSRFSTGWMPFVLFNLQRQSTENN